MNHFSHAVASAIGFIVSVIILASLLTGFSVLVNHIIGRPLTRARVISTFIVCSLLIIAMWLYHHFLAGTA